jgi:uncharacterized Zn-finger protein
MMTDYSLGTPSGVEQSSAAWSDTVPMLFENHLTAASTCQGVQTSFQDSRLIMGGHLALPLESYNQHSNSMSYIMSSSPVPGFSETCSMISDSRATSPQLERVGFMCDIPGCNKMFTMRKNMMAHKRAHSGERPHVCDFPGCGKAFTLSGILRVHRRIHTGERPFPCTVAGCTKGFKESGSLIKHMRTHTGERPFQCTECGKAFAQSGHLTRHARTHEKAAEKAGEFLLHFLWSH